MKLRLATRPSKLALVQSQQIVAALTSISPDLTVTFVEITTKGDAIQDRSLAALGGKGLFIKGLEQALLENRADIAMHSLKDMPPQLDPEFCIPAVLKRDSPHDVFVSNTYRQIAQLPIGASIGTCSVRRAAILLGLRPDLNVQICRGNVDTRLMKLDAGAFDALILAEAGLVRLGLSARITEILPLDIFIPSVGQGVIAIECLQARSDLVALLSTLNDPHTLIQMTAERALTHALGATCTSPIGSYAGIKGDTLTLTGAVFSPDGRQKLHTQHTAPLALAHATLLGERVAKDLLERGARVLLGAAQ